MVKTNFINFFYKEIPVDLADFLIIFIYESSILNRSFTLNKSFTYE